MTDQMSAETKMSLMERDIQELRTILRDNSEKILALQEERNKALIWGILALGGLVVSMIAYVANFFKEHLK